MLCQQACPQPRNASSACWLSCFYEAILGPRAGREVRLYPQAAATSSNAWGILVSKHANGSISPVITVPCPRPPPSLFDLVLHAFHADIGWVSSTAWRRPEPRPAAGHVGAAL